MQEASNTCRIDVLHLRSCMTSKILQISSDMRQAEQTIFPLVQRQASARRATAFCIFSAWRKCGLICNSSLRLDTAGSLREHTA